MRAIHSVLAQTYSDLEIIVVVDGPDQATSNALGGVSDPRLRVLHRENRGGACQARNDAILSARGTLITGLDDDDELKPDHIRLLVELLARSGAPFVAASGVTVRQEGSITRHGFTGPISPDALLFENVVGNQILTHTAYLREVGGFDSAMPAWQDYDLWVRLSQRYGPGLKVDSRTYIQHQDHGEARISEPHRIRRARDIFIEKHRAVLRPHHLASLELLVLATTHEPFGFGRVLDFLQVGLGRRAITAYLSNRFPRLRSLVLHARRSFPRLVDASSRTPSKLKR